MPKNITLTVYPFNELSPEVKKKVLDKNRDTNVLHDWSEYTLSDWKEKLEKEGFPEAEIHFSGFYSQGDGACFDSEVSIDSFATEDEKLLLKLYGVSFLIEKNPFANHYNHEHTRYIGFEAEEALNGDMGVIVKTIVERIDSKRISLCKEIYSSLQKEYEFLTSDEQVEESLIANDYHFTADGMPFNE